MRTWYSTNPSISIHRSFPSCILLGRDEPEFDQVVWLSARPTLIDGDRPAVGLFAKMGDSHPYAWVEFIEAEEECEAHLSFGWDPARLVDAYETIVSFDQNHLLGIEKFARAVADWFECLHEIPEAMDPADHLRGMMLSSLPLGDSNVWHNYANTLSAVVIRDMANAVEVQSASTKKEDLVDALAACRKQFDLHTPVCFETDGLADGQHWLAVYVDFKTKIHYRVLVSDCGGHMSFRKLSSFLGDESYYRNNANAIGTYLHRDVQDAARETIDRLRTASIDCEAITRAYTMYRSLQQHSIGFSSGLSKEIAQLNQIVEKNERKIQQLIACVKGATTTPVPTGKGTITLMGEDFPYYGHASAPNAIAGYTIEYWRASQRIGTGAEKVEFRATDLMDSMLNDAVVSMVGPPGVGKTTIIVQIAALLGVPCFVVQFTRDKPIEQLIGVDKIRGGEQVFVDGEITTALRHAASNPDVPHFVVFDEFDHAPSEVQSDFHGIVEGRDYILPNGELIENRGNLRFILTRNTTGHGDTSGRHASANISDSAFNSRIRSAFMVDYMQASEEAVLLAANGLDLDEAEQLVGFANKTRDSVANMDSGESYDGMSEPVCLRHLLSYAAARSRGVEMRKALAQCIISQLPVRDRESANEMIVACIKF